MGMPDVRGMRAIGPPIVAFSTLGIGETDDLACSGFAREMGVTQAVWRGCQKEEGRYLVSGRWEDIEKRGGSSPDTACAGPSLQSVATKHEARQLSCRSL